MFRLYHLSYTIYHPSVSRFCHRLRKGFHIIRMSSIPIMFPVPHNFPLDWLVTLFEPLLQSALPFISTDFTSALALHVNFPRCPFKIPDTFVSHLRLPVYGRNRLSARIYLAIDNLTLSTPYHDTSFRWLPASG